VEVKVVWSPYKHGMTYYYDPETGEVVTWLKYRHLKKHERARFVKAGKFYRDGRPLLLGRCELHGRWEVLESVWSAFYVEAAEKARSCEEHKALIALFRASTKLAWAYVRGESIDNLEGFLRAWATRAVRRVRSGSVAMKEVLEQARAIARFYPEAEDIIIPKLIEEVISA